MKLYSKNFSKTYCEPLLLIFVFFININLDLSAQNNWTQYVNPFVGTAAHGHTFPGATMPFSMVQLSPDTRVDGSWDGCSGYHYSDSLIYGFSHTHLSGTGCSDYGDIAFLPVFVKNKSDKLGNSDTLFAKFNHKTESAKTGYYSVNLKEGKIKVELSSSTRVGIQKYTYQNAGYTWIYLNLQHRDELLEGKITQMSPKSFGGLRRSKAWAQNQLLYYYFEVNYVPDEVQILSSEWGQTKLRLGFKVTKAQSILIKTSLSSVDENGAILNMKKEMPHWNFEQVKKEANLAWNKELNRIKVYGGSLKVKQNFYTALYHCMIHPNVMNDVDGRYMGRDKKVHVAEGFDYYTVFSLWDTYRALHPLLNIIDKKRSHDFIMTFKAQYEQSGRLPMWELWGNETNCMIGFHSVSVILDAYMKKVITWAELKSIYPAIKAEAMSNRFGLDKFREKGFLSIEDESESVSKTLEYSYDMNCVATIAFYIGNKEDDEYFSKFSRSWKNLRDKDTRFMTPRENGGWIKNFDPKEVNNHFTEANAWQYNFAVQHDIRNVNDYYRLSQIFNTDSKTTGREQSDITGLIGQYAQGNEPSHHVAYSFRNLDSAKKYVSKICNDFYKPEPDGLCGNEDCGQMSAWYVFSAMGFYPIDPSSNEYYFGAPQFDSVRFKNGDHSTVFHVKSKPDLGNEKYKYFESSFSFYYNDEREYFYGYDQMYLSAAGGEIPPYLSAPLIVSEKQVFSESLNVKIKSNNHKTPYGYKGKYMEDTIYYTLDGSIPTKNSILYEPYYSNIFINKTTQLNAISTISAGVKSNLSTAYFYKRPNNYSIQIKSVYNTQYTAGGADGLLDGLKGDTDWRKGRWQGYQGQDFECVIDMKTIKNIDSLRFGFLQDKGSWIFLPKTVIIYGSNDSLDFKKISSIEFANSDSDENVKRIESSIKINSNYRYIKIEVQNFGKLPEWHPGKGGDTFIFIDEITIY